MARARNIKPSFFTNDELAEIPPLGRLLFIGLWTIADREGRLHDRPKRIKAEVLPYDEADADALLNELHKRKFILRYEVDGNRYIQICAFCKHQNPHQKESASCIPLPVDAGKVQAPDKHSASTVQEADEQQPKPERAGLIPDSPFLIPDSPSLIPDSPFVPPPDGDGENEGGESDDAKPAEKRQRGSRKCPESFVVDDELLEWAAKNVPGLDVIRETEAFRDHEFAKARSDWRGTWRNWMRRAWESMPKNRRGRETTEEHNARVFAEFLGFGQGEVIDA